MATAFDVKGMELTKLPPSASNVDMTEMCKPKELLAMGWGVTELNVTSKIFLCVKVPIIHMSKCIELYGKDIKPNSHQVFCAVSSPVEKDTCQGDSGGPVLCEDIQVGIVSWGSRPCGGVQGTAPAVYTRTDAYLKFINQLHSIEADPKIIMVILLIFVIIVLLLLLYFRWVNTFWKRKGLKYSPPILFFGNMLDTFLQRKSLTERSLELYKEIKSLDKRHGGIWFLTFPFYLPIDVEIIKSILLKDFDHFVDHGNYYNEETEPLTGHLFNLEGIKWKSLRTKMTPVFTSSKMKLMFHTMTNCTIGLKEILEKKAIAEEPLKIKSILARFTTDIIGSCAFGLDCNCLQNPESEFEKYGQRIFKRTLFENMSVLLCNTLPRSLTTMLGLKTMGQDITDFFMGVIKDTVKHREKNNIYRNDFVQLLLQLKNQNTNDVNSEAKFSLTESEFAAQCFVFFAAGFETSSTLMTFALFELAREENKTIQEKLREEINDVLQKCGNELTYDAVMEMSYLDKIVNETLRKHPPLSVTQRVCTKDYKIPDTDIIIEKGIKVWIPIAGIQMDPDYYPDPEKFDPERFSEENKNTRPGYTWLPFGEGPRICIGARFGLMQSKVGLITIIRNFRITLNQNTRVPLKLSAKNFISEVEGEVWLNAKKINIV